MSKLQLTRGGCRIIQSLANLRGNLVSSNIFYAMFLATSPFIFMPSIIALLTRNPRKIWVLAGNVLVWATGFLMVSTLISGTDGFSLPAPIFGAGWIALLFLAIRKPSPAPTSQDKNDA
jgi:hypothetical protein